MATAAGVHADVAKAGVRRVLWVTLLLNVIVSGSKIVVGKLTGSLSMVADGYHSLMDGSNNVIGLVVTTFAYAPPDEGHPYGHRKFETAATLFIGLALLGLAYNVVENALSAAGGSRLPEIGVINWLVMGVTLAV
ncbi:MAG TPA: cation transporter, partial [Vicinamibacteria bacterium]|nr:cation transporter [Vicinamibacteria bacterium]